MTRTVWIVNHYAHHLDRDGRATRHQHLAAGAVAHGWRTVVISAGTDHPTGRAHLRGARLRERWSGDGYEFCWLRGVDHRGGGARRAVRRCADIALFTVLLLMPGALRGLPSPDVVVGGSFHPFAAWAASVLARRHRVPFVFEPRDLWPESAIALAGWSERHPVVRVLRWVDRTTVDRAVHLVSPLEGVGDHYAARGQVHPFTWIPNGIAPDDDATDGRSTREAPSGTDASAGAPFTITYIGSMGPANALETVLDAFAAARRRSVAGGGPDLRLCLVGDGSDVGALRQRVTSLQAAASVTWTGRLRQEDARTVGRRAGCLVVALRDHQLYRRGVSLNKIVEYMLLARPLLVSAPVPIRPVAEADCGLQVAAGSVDALAEGMLALAGLPAASLDAMGARGRAHVLAEYDYERLAARFAAVLDEVTT